MFKKATLLLAAATLSLSLVACSSKEATENTNNSSNNQVKEETTKNKTSDKGKTYTMNNISVNESGVVQTIKSVSVFDNMKDAVKSYGQSELVIGDENKDKTTVVVNFEIKNNNDFMISTYPAQAKIITNTGEQVEADLFASESFDGDIYGGVTKEGHVLFSLPKTKADELKSFKIVWNTSHDNGTSDNYDDDFYKENQLDITLN